MVTGLSDHNLTLVARKLTDKRFCPFAKEYESFGIPKNEQENFNSAVQQIDQDDLLLGICPEEDSQIFSKNQKAVLKILTANLGTKRTNTVPWINADIFKTNERTRSGLKNCNMTDTTLLV